MAAILAILAALTPVQEADLKAKIKELIQRLEAESIEERERATKDLAALGEPALQELESAANQTQGESSNRIRSAIKVIKRGLYLRNIKKSEFKGVVEKHPEILGALATGSLEERGKAIVAIGGVRRIPRGISDGHRDKTITIPTGLRARLLVEFLGGELSEISRVEALHALYLLNRRLVEEGSKPVLWVAFDEEATALIAATGAGRIEDRVVATTAIAGIAGPVAEERLVALGSDEDPNVRYVALRGLQARSARNRAPFILERARTEVDSYCFSAAMEILAYVGGPEAASFLLDVFNGKADVRKGSHEYEKPIAAWALGRLGHRPAADAVATLLESKIQPEMTCGAKALAVLGEPRHASKLVPLLANTLGNWDHDRAWVRWDAAAGLSRIGIASEAKAIRELMAGEDVDARTLAAALLVRAGESVDPKLMISCLGEDTPSRSRLLVTVNRPEKPALPTDASAWRIIGWAYATGVNWAGADSVHRGVQLHFLYCAERSANVGQILREVAAAASWQVHPDIAKEALMKEVTLRTPFLDPNVEEVLVALAAAGFPPILEGLKLRIVPVAEAVEHWKKKLGELK